MREALGDGIEAEYRERLDDADQSGDVDAMFGIVNAAAHDYRYGLQRDAEPLAPGTWPRRKPTVHGKALVFNDGFAAPATPLTAAPSTAP